MRDVHTWLGMLFAPSLLFFAITGALQLYDLHVVRPGRAFEPPAWLQELGMVHKDQVFRMPRRRPPPPAPTVPEGSAMSSQGDAPSGPAWATQILKAFCLAVALGLVASTGLGIWLGLKSGRNRRLSLCLLLAGAVVPSLLLAF